MSGINDVTQVLREVATALKKKGFFEDPNWSGVLINIFKDVQESNEKSIIDDLDNAHEISNSFAEEHSKFNKFKKPVDDPFSDMFDDSNASFEIPETQADPPREDQGDDMDDELNSEAFVGIPDDEMQTNYASQSQDLLGGVSLLDSQVNETHDEDKTTGSKGVEDVENNCKFQDDDSDTTDLEMSKLEWDEKEEYHNRSASVTPDLDFDILSSTKVAGTDNIKSASVTPDLDFDQLTAAASNLLPHCTNSDSKSKENDISFGMDRTKVEKDIPTVPESFDKPEDADTREIDIADQIILNGVEEEQADATQVFTKPTKPKKNPVASVVETEATQLFIKPSELKKIETADRIKLNGEEEQADATQVFTKPTKPTTNPIASVVETEATQLFMKPMSSTSELKKMNEDNEYIIKNGVDDLEETQLFVKANDLNGEIEHEEEAVTHKANARKRNGMIFSSSDEEDTDDNPVKCDSKFMTTLESADDEPAKSNGVINADVEDDEYSAATQIFEVKKFDIQILNTSEEKAHKEVPKNNGRVVKTNGMEAENTDNDDEEDDIATQKFELQKDKSRKRNHLLSSSDEENDDENLLTPMRVSESPLPTEPVVKKNKKDVETSVKIESDENNEDATSTSMILESKKYSFLKDLKDADWHQLCDEANTKQSNVKFVNAFDQSKELRLSVQNKLPTTSQEVKEGVDRKSVNVNEEIENSTTGNVRKSSRNKKRAGNSESYVTSDGESKTSKPKKSRRINAPEILSVSSSKSLSKVTKSYDGDVEMEATQAFVKASSSTEKEEMKPSRASSRRQVKPTSSTVTTETVAKHVKEPIRRRLREGYNQSATYSPGPSNLATSVSSDENENNNTKPIKGNRDQGTSDASSRRARKTKATEVFPVDEQTEAAHSSFNDSSETFDSVNRTSRNINFRVMFTMIDPEPYKPILKELNITTVNADDSYNALITDRVYRTTKFMCALASGKPIVSINWLEALKKGKPVPDPFKFLLCDKHGEEKYKFSLAKTIREVGKSGGLFRNHSILVTPNTSPGPEVFKDVITSSGGKYLKTSLVPRKDDVVICISDKKDEKMWSQLKKKYPTLKQIINVEGFMQAIFQYNSDLKKFVMKN